MKKIFRRVCLAVGALVALAIISVTGLYFLGDHVIAVQRTACEGSEDFAAVRSQLKKAFEDGTIDKPVVDREDQAIDRALDACASGDKGSSRALLLGVMMDASMQSDEVYARKVNGVPPGQPGLAQAGVANRQGDPEKPKQNPRPSNRYEIVATTNAPGEWDSVSGALTFIADKECAPAEYWKRAWKVPNVEYSFEMTRSGPTTWKGYFFRDALQGEDYFGLGVCHWDAAHVAANFTVHGATFQESAMTYFDGRQKYDPETSYFLKSQLFDKTVKGDYLTGFSHYNADTTRFPDNYFTISAKVEKASP